MDYHQNARLTIYRREQLARKVMEEGSTLKLAAASFSVSAKTAAKWVRRYREGGRGGLADHSSRPRRMPRQTCFSLERVTKPTEPDLRRRSSVNGVWPRRCFQIGCGILSNPSCRFLHGGHKVADHVFRIARA